MSLLGIITIILTILLFISGFFEDYLSAKNNKRIEKILGPLWFICLIGLIFQFYTDNKSDIVEEKEIFNVVEYLEKLEEEEKEREHKRGTIFDYYHNLDYGTLDSHDTVSGEEIFDSFKYILTNYKGFKIKDVSLDTLKKENPSEYFFGDSLYIEMKLTLVKDDSIKTIWFLLDGYDSFNIYEKKFGRDNWIKNVGEGIPYWGQERYNN